jgi:hypothetical protein
MHLRGATNSLQIIRILSDLPSQTMGSAVAAMQHRHLELPMSETPSRQVNPALEKNLQFLVWLVPTLKGRSSSVGPSPAIRPRRRQP